MSHYAHQIGREIGEALRPAFRITICKREVAAFDIAEIAQRATGGFHLRVGGRRAELQHAQARDPRRLLRSSHERPGCCAAEQVMKSRRLI